MVILSKYIYKKDKALGVGKVVVGLINDMVGLLGFSFKKLTGFSFRPEKSGCINKVIILIVVRWVPLY